MTHKINDLMGENVTGSFYEKELQKTHNQEFFRIERVRKHDQKNIQILVKWKGYPDRLYSWILNLIMITIN